jgi:hypothetical protein
MNDQRATEGFWSDPLSLWLQQATWLEWLQPVLYFVLSMALASLLFTLLDLAMMCWKEFHHSAATNGPSATGPSATLSPPRKSAQAGALRFLFRP